MLRSHKTITATEMRGVNRSAVLELIRTDGPISKSKIASELQVSLPTVSRVVEELIEEKLVHLNGKKESTGGRKRELYEFNAHEHLTIGVDMRANSLYGAVADFGGIILTERTIEVNNLSDVGVYHILEDLIVELLNFAKKTSKQVRGIGIAAPGITYYDEGIVKWAPTLDWKDFPLKQKLQETFNLPVILDNDVNISALGEMWFGAGRYHKNLVYIMLDQGIGAGIIIDGDIYRGSHLTAGEIGFLVHDVENLNQKWEGVGATESFAGIPGIITRAKNSLEAQKVNYKPTSLTIDNVFNAYCDGEKWSLDVVNDTINRLAQVVIAISVCFDPNIIVLSGEISRFSDIIIDGILSKINGCIPILPKIVPTTLGKNAAIMGIVISVLHNISDFYVIKKMK